MFIIKDNHVILVTTVGTITSKIQRRVFDEELIWTVLKSLKNGVVVLFKNIVM